MLFFHGLVAVDLDLDISVDNDWLFQVFSLWLPVVMPGAYSCLQRSFQLDVVLCQIFLDGVMVDGL